MTTLLKGLTPALCRRAGLNGEPAFIHPSEQLERPYAIVGVNIIAAETDDDGLTEMLGRRGGRRSGRDRGAEGGPHRVCGSVLLVVGMCRGVFRARARRVGDPGLREGEAAQVRHTKQQQNQERGNDREFDPRDAVALAREAFKD